MKYLLMVFLCLISFPVLAQEEPPPPTPDSPIEYLGSYDLKGFFIESTEPAAKNLPLCYKVGLPHNMKFRLYMTPDGIQIDEIGGDDLEFVGMDQGSLGLLQKVLVRDNYDMMRAFHLFINGTEARAEGYLFHRKTGTKDMTCVSGFSLTGTVEK